jgi:hypothetical protein
MRAARAVAERVRELLLADDGLAYTLAELEAGPDLEGVREEQVVRRHAAPEDAERTGLARYPSWQVYCERLENRQTERFRSFSGVVTVVVEIRTSSDRLERVEDQTMVCTEAALAILERKRGDLGDGLFWSGGYEASFGTVKRGGSQWMQTAKVVCRMDLNRD